MNCQRFELVASELARGQMMEADVRGEALAHLDACEECRLRLRDEETLTRGLQSLAGEMAALNAPDGLELRLREAFRSRRIVATQRHSNSRYWIAAVAAVLLIAMSVIAVRWRTEQRDGVTDVTASGGRNEPAQIEDEPKVVDSPKPQRQEEAVLPKPRRRSVRRAPRTEVANHVTREIATDFMPLGYLSPVTLQDGGQIVRVELPRSALANFGLPVNMDRYHEKVKADVLLGVDGLAHAIRFVQ